MLTSNQTLRARIRPSKRLLQFGDTFPVIPGPAEGRNPESRCARRASFWIPGPALKRRPGMTTEGLTPRVAALTLPDKRHTEETPWISEFPAARPSSARRAAAWARPA